MNDVFQISRHAQGRMATRKISRYKVAKAVFFGQIFASANGLHKAKLWEKSGKTVDEYIVVFNKKSSTVVTVEHNVLRHNDFDDNGLSRHEASKLYKQRKRIARAKEFDSWCREEYENYNLAFSA